jgi:hypothetical protein
MKAKISNIPDSDDVLRWIKKRLILRGHNEEFLGIDHEVFKLRSDPVFLEKHKGVPEKSLSINWINYFQGAEIQRIKSVIEDYTGGLESKKISNNAYFSKINVGKLKSICLKHNAKVRVIHHQTKNIKSHGEITQLPQDNSLLFDDLCELAKKSVNKVSDY